MFRLRVGRNYEILNFDATSCNYYIPVLFTYVSRSISQKLIPYCKNDAETILNFLEKYEGKLSSELGKGHIMVWEVP